MIEQIVASLRPRMKEQSVETSIDIPDDQTVTADRELLDRAVRSLMLNAMDAMPEGGAVTIISTDGPQGLEIEVSDTGPSLTDEQREQVATLAHSAERGTVAWGLAVVYRVAELHGGKVAVANCPEGGVAFTLRIPHAAALEAAA